MSSIEQTYQRWLKEADASLQAELIAMDEAAKEDAFYRSLAFGTGGLRGVIGAGTNRMNIHTVAKASQGLADYVVKHFPADKRRIAVSYDSRILSDEFARVASGVFAANGIKAMIYPQLMPTPCLSYAVRALECAAGVMVTASHNPAKYNGYKVYGADGCQITTEAAAEILSEIEKLDVFADIQRVGFEDGLKSGEVSYIPDQVYTDFVEEVKKQSWLKARPAHPAGKRLHQRDGRQGAGAARRPFPHLPLSQSRDPGSYGAGTANRRPAERRPAAGHRPGLRPLRHRGEKRPGRIRAADRQ